MNKLLSGALVLALFAGCAAAACGACSNACTITAHEQKTGITEEQPFSTVSCDGFGGSTTRRGSWYMVNGTGETFMAELCDENTDYDTVIAVFNECNAKCIAYDDDGCGAKRSSVTFATTVGKSYYIFVTGFANETGNYVLALTPVEQPTNFRCDRAVNVTEVPFAAYDDTTLAPTSIRRCEESNGTTATGLWYKLVSGHGSYVLAKTCNEGTVLDTVIDVYMGDCLSDGGASECIVWNDDSCGVKSEVTFFAVPTTTYYIFVGGYGTTTGRFLFEIEDYSPNANSRCTNPIDVNEIPFVYDGHTGNATESYSNCQNTNRRGQWFLYRGHGLYMDAFTCAFDNTKTTFDNVIDVYTECNDDGTTGDCLIYNDDYCLRNARVRFFARTNVEYWIYVNGYTASTSGGNYTLTIEPSVNDTNTQCWKAHHINELPYDYSQDTFSLPTSLSGCSSPRTEKSGRWYSYYHNSMSSAEIEVDTCNDATTVATHIEVYQSCDSTTCKQTETKCSDDKEFAVFTAAPYQTYYIFIYGDTEGYIHVEFELHEAVAHAKCTDAITVPSTPYESAGLTTNAAYVKSNCTGDFEQGQWFLVKGTGKKMAASTCSEATDFDTTIDLYGSCRENARCMATNNDYYNCGERSKISWQSFKNANYYIYVHGHSSSHGVYILQIYDEASPDNAVCTGALEIPSLPYTAQGITTYAHTSNGTCHENVASKGVWYWFTGTGYKVRISTCFDETEFDTMIDIYEGCANDMGHNCFTESDDSTCGTKADLTFNAYKGTTYYVFVTSSVTSVESEGFFELVIQQVSPIYPTDSGSSGLSSGAKAGIAIGVIAGVGAAAGAGFFFWKKRTLRADYNVIS